MLGEVSTVDNQIRIYQSKNIQNMLLHYISVYHLFSSNLFGRRRIRMLRSKRTAVSEATKFLLSGDERSTPLLIQIDIF